MKTLLITSVPPNRGFSGTLLTWHLSKNFNDQQLFGFFPTNKHLKHVKAEFPNPGNYNCKYTIKTREAALRHKFVPTLISGCISFAREMYRKYVEIPSLTRKVIRYAKEHQIDRIWIILEGQTIIWLAERLIRKNTFPVYAQVWDSPVWWVKANRLDALSSKIVCKAYEFVVKKAKQFGSASFNMSKIYKQRYGKESFPLIGITPDSDFKAAPIVRDPNKFVIGIAGQVYATHIFAILVKALDSMYWILDGREIEIHYWGNSYLPKKRTRIIRRGYLSQEQLCHELTQCDVLYCPYWFDKRFEEVVKTSFPSKITSYIKAKVIILFHGPSYSSPGMMLSEANAAICCFSVDLEVIKLNLRKAIYCKDKEDRLKAAKQLLEHQLSEDYLHKSFRNFLEIGGP